MSKIRFTTNPKSEKIDQEQDERFKTFNEQLIQLIEQFGYSDFVVTVLDRKSANLYSSVQCETLAGAEMMRRKVSDIIKDFINHAIIKL